MRVLLNELTKDVYWRIAHNELPHLLEKACLYNKLWDKLHIIRLSVADEIWSDQNDWEE